MNKETLEFKEVISDYLRNLMLKVKSEKGELSREYNALFYQYIRTDSELLEMKEHNMKHYEAVVDHGHAGLQYVERLYKRQATVDLTTACSAHCRYCLRQNYSHIKMTQEDQQEIVKYIADDPYLKEILITGGDPLLVPDILLSFMNRIMNEAPNIKIIRIGTRLPVQNPNKLDERLLKFFYENKHKMIFEIALQINHKVEMQNETINCIQQLQESGVTIYAQNVLLKNVNDDMDSLIDLYDALRYMRIESHYLFHPVPICRTAQFRMPLEQFLDIARKLTASGEIPGRSKPMFAVMTDIGKCTLYEGTLLDKDEDGYYEINTAYRLEERLKWNARYILPESAKVSKEGYLIVKYLDGEMQ